MYRNNNHSLKLYGKLFHQYLVDLYAKVEHQHLSYIRHHQSTLRAELYQGLRDAISSNDRDITTIGTGYILPSSFIGGPRHMAELYQDAMSIVRRFEPPDYFINFCMQCFMARDCQFIAVQSETADRPDLCSRVFHMNLKSLIEDIVKNDILGKVVTYISVIEFQKGDCLTPIYCQ